MDEKQLGCVYFHHLLLVNMDVQLCNVIVFSLHVIYPQANQSQGIRVGRNLWSALEYSIEGGGSMMSFLPPTGNLLSASWLKRCRKENNWEWRIGKADRKGKIEDGKEETKQHRLPDMIMRLLHTDLIYGLNILELSASTSWPKEIIWVIYKSLIHIMADFYFHFYTFSPFSNFSTMSMYYSLVPQNGLSLISCAFLISCLHLCTLLASSVEWELVYCHSFYSNCKEANAILST